MNPDNQFSHADEAALADLLKHIGKRVFVQYYEAFRQEDIPNTIFNGENFTEKSKNSRKSKARKIFKNGWDRRALQMVVESVKIDNETKAKANTLLAHYFGEGR